ncbi:MarR family winged helix-turn-helix transcriptional regulator [Parerythrobacter jejuensis]|uniref:MarR family transcriptional regulator n=1 Tax=Parerythrobacter jejuensis TaxID=795812 RepID=A0A845AR54_9SPHN|nr:MarR family transcriptional regulator [Parerythrobacter jejuensis]MXP31877.1 MarR family transcriptional regulator [Parerythrobacter jejuensis]
MPDTPADNPVYQLFNEIGIISQLSSAAFREVLPRPLNEAMFGVLNHFCRLGDGKSPSYLAEAFQVARPSMTATLDKLERAGLVRIEAHPSDARGKLVFITDAGRAAREEAVAAVVPLFADIAPVLGTLDTDQLLRDLATLRKALDQAR